MGKQFSNGLAFTRERGAAPLGLGAKSGYQALPLLKLFMRVCSRLDLASMTLPGPPPAYGQQSYAATASLLLSLHAFVHLLASCLRHSVVTSYRKKCFDGSNESITVAKIRFLLIKIEQITINKN